ncbi:hypothetical protein X975_09459, partial [Stegodyphus mimosarum]
MPKNVFVSVLSRKHIKIDFLCFVEESVSSSTMLQQLT